MDAKELAKDLWTKIRQWGRARLDELTPLDMLSLAINPPRKDKILDEEEEYAVALISSALSAQAAEVERLKNKGNELARQLDKLINHVNAVTAFHRHGEKIPSYRLYALSNIQIEVEDALNALRILSPPPAAPEPTP